MSRIPKQGQVSIGGKGGRAYGRGNTKNKCVEVGPKQGTNLGDTGAASTRCLLQSSCHHDNWTLVGENVSRLLGLKRVLPQAHLNPSTQADAGKYLRDE